MMEGGDSGYYIFIMNKSYLGFYYLEPICLGFIMGLS